MATQRLIKPATISEMIIWDADTYHFGTPEFKQTDAQIKKEIELLTGSVQTSWVSKSIRMLRNHQFYTSYCKQQLEAGKQENIDWLQSLL